MFWSKADKHPIAYGISDSQRIKNLERTIDEISEYYNKLLERIERLERTKQDIEVCLHLERKDSPRIWAKFQIDLLFGDIISRLNNLENKKS